MAKLYAALSTKISPETAQLLEDYCQQSGETKSATIEAAIKMYISKNKKARE